MNARTLTKALGGRWHAGYGMARCPAHADRTPSLKLSDDPRKNDGVDVMCFAGCDWREVKAAFRSMCLLELSQSTRVLREPRVVSAEHRNRNRALQLFDESAPISLGSPGWCYLVHHRNLDLAAFGDLSHALRWHPAQRAVVALFRDLGTNDPCGIHRTFLAADATKLGRKMLGRSGGAAIKLDGDDSVTFALHVGEGIETCLAARQLGHRPVWALGSAPAISSLPVLPAIEALHILAEHDDEGANASAIQRCARRWLDAGREVFVCDPPKGDFNNLLGCAS